MDQKKLLKYFNGDASGDEIREIYEWYSASKENQDLFFAAKAHHTASGFADTASKVNIAKSWEKFQDLTTPNLRQRYSYAAAAIFLFGISFVIYVMNLRRGSVPESLPENVIALDFGNGKMTAINDSANTLISDINGRIVCKQQGNILRYSDSYPLIADGKPIRHTLTVPYGKTFRVSLSDGTLVTINSGSSITYDPAFNDDIRNVSINGEAFFEVAKDSLHPFIVHTGNIDIRVLGTKFNISSYQDDSLLTTALIEGSVALYKQSDGFKNGRLTLLKPGQAALWRKDAQMAEVKSVDAALYKSWVEGKMIFKHMPFQEIIKNLQRHYNVKITNDKGVFKDQRFTVHFDNETIEQVMETFRLGYGLKYQIKGREIIINR